MNLVIVESPAKGKTIEKYLGKDFKVRASFGHVRDLPKSKIGVDIKNNFTPEYVIPAKSKKVIKILKDEASGAEALYLATDFDREGEAIAWHLIEAIKPKKLVKRITFHEITKDAITAAVKHPREIDINLVDAQQARRVLDRLVGYKLSPFLWQKVARGLSAGRVQSVALRLIVEREREIQKFQPAEYWTIEVILHPADKTDAIFKAILAQKDGQKIDKLEIKNKAEAQKYLDELNGADYIVKDIAEEEKNRYPSPPFTTSTLQQEAARKLGFSAKQTMRVAQDLYEQGLITYMRTDSVQVSKSALAAAAKIIAQKYGAAYALSSPRFYKTKTRGAQEAHEAIRPTDLANDPARIMLDSAHAKLYKLIWQRMIASQMAEAKVLATGVKIGAGDFIFNATGTQIKFDGFLKVYNVENDEAAEKLPELEVGQKLTLQKLEKIQHFTEPPARYGEGTLIKELEKRGIGRPSTYAPTLSTIIDRGYAEKVRGKLIPKDIGLAASDILVEHFPEIVDYNFTAKMEEELDEIAEGKLKWLSVIKEFYEPFSQHLSKKMETVQKNQIEEETGEKCPQCGQNLVIKLGRFGKFMACKGFPDCKFTKPLTAKDAKTKQAIAASAGQKCPKCAKSLALKEGRFGPFLACSGYPQCKYTQAITIKAEAPCPNCGGDLVRKTTKKGRTFWGCANFPKCKTAFWQEPTKEK